MTATNPTGPSGFTRSTLPLPTRPPSDQNGFRVEAPKIPDRPTRASEVEALAVTGGAGLASEVLAQVRAGATREEALHAVIARQLESTYGPALAARLAPHAARLVSSDPVFQVTFDRAFRAATDACNER